MASDDNSRLDRQHRVVGCLMGLAIGDAIGLPFENLSRRQVEHVLGTGAIKHRFLWGHGMVSDDTDHACLVAQSILESGAELDPFGHGLAKRLRCWILGLPAGTGAATARACFRLWFTKSHENAGVFSAGNGPSMRAPIIGAVVDDLALVLALTSISTRMTHSDPKADYGAKVVAAIVNRVVYHEGADAISPELVMRVTRDCLPNDPAADELQLLIQAAVSSAESGDDTVDFAQQQGWHRGVSGYTYHTVPAVIHSCLRYPGDYATALSQLIRCGGDTDSTAAIAGAIFGAAYGESCIPDEWRYRIWEFPRSPNWLRRLAEQLAEFKVGVPMKAIVANPLLLFVRNLLFLGVVLLHVLRRIPLMLTVRS